MSSQNNNNNDNNDNNNNNSNVTPKSNLNPEAGAAAAGNDAAQIQDRAVADYLRRHPQFFKDKPTLLADMRIPHATGGAISLVERQIVALREVKERQQKQLDNLLQIARDNDQLNQRLHQFTLGIIRADSLEALATLLDERLRKDFAADRVSLHLLTEMPAAQSLAQAFVSDRAAFITLFQRLLSAGKPYCGRLTTDQINTLGVQQDEQIGSSALLPLGKQGRLGLLVIGSDDRQRFNTHIDTAFLARMADIIGTALSRHLGS